MSKQQQADSSRMDRIAYNIRHASDVLGNSQAYRHVENLFGQFNQPLDF